MTSVQCPDGYRPIKMSEIAVGMSVNYINTQNVWTPTQVEDASILENKEGHGVRLVHKHNAALSRIFVRTEAQAKPGTADIVSRQNTEAAADIASGQNTEAAVGAEPNFDDSDIQDANAFLKSAVAPWIESMVKDAKEQEVYLPPVFKEKHLSFLN